MDKKWEEEQGRVNSLALNRDQARIDNKSLGAIKTLREAIKTERESYTAIIDDLSQKNKDLTWTCERLIHALEVAERKLADCEKSKALYS
jgi:hypothetical protein